VRLGVRDDAERVYVAHVLLADERGAVRLEEHVLEEVREAVELGRLGERAVAHGQLDRDERHRVVFEHDDFEAVRQNLVDEGRGLGQRRGGLRGGGRGPRRRGARGGRVALRRGGEGSGGRKRRRQKRRGQREDGQVASRQF
jgi:hypothetical protein